MLVCIGVSLSTCEHHFTDSKSPTICFSPASASRPILTSVGKISLQGGYGTRISVRSGVAVHVGSAHVVASFVNCDGFRSVEGFWRVLRLFGFWESLGFRV